MRRIFVFTQKKLMKNWLEIVDVYLFSLPTYYMSLFEMPQKVTSNIERLFRNYLWKDDPHLVCWNIVNLPIEKGGLDLFSVKNNKALAKWIWGYHHEEIALWRNLLKAKYIPTSDKNQPPSSSVKGPWKYIKKHQNLITNRICHGVGDGGSTSYWNDTCIENTMLVLQYPLLYRLFHSKKATMKETWNVVNKFWDLKLGRNLKDNEAMEWTKLSLDLAPVVLSNETDSLTWFPRWRVFSTKSLMMDMGEKVEAINPTLAKTIWKWHHPNKVKFFLWEIAHNAISTSENLQERMPYITLSPNWCLLCKKENESHSHLFTYAQNFWTTILNIFGWHLTFSMLYSDDISHFQWR